MRDVGHEQVQRLVSEAIRRGYSTQTAKHILTAVSALFTHAEKIEWFTGRNPARFVKLPEMTRRPARALSSGELKALLFALKPKARAMVLCASLTSMNIAEVCGLRWKRVNLSGEPVVVDGELIPAYHIAVREQWYRREFGSVKAAARRRNLPMASPLIQALSALREQTLGWSPESIVFEGRNGRPVSADALLKRQIHRAAKGVGIPNLGWHDLRRSFETLADEFGITIGERKALMGHSRAEMTLRYNHTSTDRAQAALERMAENFKEEEREVVN